MTDPTEREPARDVPTALAEAGVPSGPLRSTLSVERFRDDVAHDLAALRAHPEHGKGGG